MEIKDTIKARRLELGLTMLDVSKKVGVSEATISRWESGDIANMKRDRIVLLADALDLSPAVIMGWDEEKPIDIFNLPGIEPLPRMKRIPLLGTIACGEPLLAEENLEGFTSLPCSMDADFSLRCKGDSMITARIFDGDIVFIRQQSDVDDGEIAAVRIGNDATLKKVYKYPSRLVLRACNPMYEDIIYTDSELKNIEIIGKAVYFLSAVR